MSIRMASPDSGRAAVRNEMKGLSATGRSGNAVRVILLMRTSRTRSVKAVVGAGGGPDACASGGAGVGTGEVAAAGVAAAFLPPRISPFRTEGTSVRNSSLRTAERAMPPKIATIGFQIPRPLNFRSVIPFGDSNSSDSIETFGRNPLPRTISRPFATPKCIFVITPSTASAVTLVLGAPSTSSVYFGIAGTVPAIRSASTSMCPSLTRAPRLSSVAPIEGGAAGVGAGVGSEAD